MKRDKDFQMIEGSGLLGLVVLMGCHSLKSTLTVDRSPVRPAPKTDTTDLSYERGLKGCPLSLCDTVISRGSGISGTLLMLEERVVVKGSCFGYVNAF